MKRLLEHKIIITTGAIILLASFVLLLSDPIGLQGFVIEHYKKEYESLLSQLGEMKMTSKQLERSIAFSLTKTKQEIWLRWGACALFFIFFESVFIGYLKTRCKISQLGLLTGSVIYFLVWFLDFDVIESSKGTSLLKSFIMKILINLALKDMLLSMEFFLVYILAPIACIVLMCLFLMGHDSSALDK